MATKFIGDVEWEVAEPTLYNVDNWGLDEAKVLYRGAAPKMAAFADTLPRFGSLAPHPSMYLVHWDVVNITPSFPGIELVYKGFRSGTIPPVKISDGVSLQTAQGEGTDSTFDPARKITGSFLYRAQRTSYNWFEKQDPHGQCRYSTVRIKINPLSQIIAYHMSDPETGEPINWVRYSSFIAVFNHLLVQEIVSDFGCEEVIPRTLWACHSDVDYKIVS